MHGWGGNKGAFEATLARRSGGANYHYNNVYFAQQGYAVITTSARGFGRSCGAADSRTCPACDRGWVRLADHRYEGRDTQYLLGRLVDQGVIKPRAIGVTGISYGGIQSVTWPACVIASGSRTGRFRPWRSPRGTRLRIAAAYPRWGGFGPHRVAAAQRPLPRLQDAPGGQSIRPGGVSKKSYNDGLYRAGMLSGFYAPDGRAVQRGHHGWKTLTDRGEPATRRRWRSGASSPLTTARRA